MKSRLVLCAAFCLLVSRTYAISMDLESTSPLLMWSNQRIVGQGTGAQVLYNVLTDAEDATATAVLGIFGKEDYSSNLVNTRDASAEGMTIVIFAGSQLGSSDLRQGKATKLSAVLDAAASSLVLPFASGQSNNMAKSVQQTLEAAGLAVQAVGCSHAASDLVHELSGALASSIQPQVVVVCPQNDPSLSGTQSGLEQELDQLLSVQEVLDASETKHMIVYMSLKADTQTRRRRILAEETNSTVFRAVPGPLTGFANYTTCGALCQTQVRWLEGMLAVLFMALACCAGLTCLNVMSTPTRFEAATE